MVDQSSKGQNSRAIHQTDNDTYFYHKNSEKNFENQDDRLSSERWDHSSDTQTRSNIHISGKISDEKGEKIDLEGGYKEKTEHSIDFGSISATEHSQFQNPDQEGVNIFGILDNGVHLKELLFSSGRSSGAIKFERPDDIDASDKQVTFDHGSSRDSAEGLVLGGGSHVAAMQALLAAELEDQENTDLSNHTSEQNGDENKNNNTDLSHDQTSLTGFHSSEETEEQHSNQDTFGNSSDNNNGENAHGEEQAQETSEGQNEENDEQQSQESENSQSGNENGQNEPVEQGQSGSEEQQSQSENDGDAAESENHANN
ncbi:MAG: hypothetical protein H6912_02095 [Kordiimonadaceae bacterium]|nr:hypothetical protein [Kordiimonadaceae bacterium]